MQNRYLRYVAQKIAKVHLRREQKVIKKRQREILIKTLWKLLSII